MRRSNNLSAIARLSLLVVAVAPLSGCELAGDLYNWANEFYNDPITLIINVESPSETIEVTPQVNAVEDGMCEDRDSESCLILSEIDKTDDDMVTSPNPRIPDEFPASVTVEDDMGNQVPDPDAPCDPLEPLGPENCPPWEVSIDEFMEESGVYDEIDISEIIPVDLTEEIDVSAPDAIRSVEIRRLGINYVDNELTFDTVPLALYMSEELLEEDADADALIDNGEVTYLGTIEAQPALTDGTRAIDFESDASRQVFVDGVISRQFTLVFRVPPGTVFQLSDSPNDPSMKLKPKGQTDIALVAAFAFVVTPRELVGRARDAYENERDEITAD